MLPAGILGTLLGGVIIEKMKLKCKQIMKGQIAVSVITVFFALALLVNCQQIKFAGINVDYDNTTT